MIASFPGIESLLEDPPEKHDDLVRVRWIMAFYGMEPRVSKKAEDVQDTLEYLLENWSQRK
jgi:hypothetical protein